MYNTNPPEMRLANFVQELRKKDLNLITTGIDFTEVNPMIHVKWAPKEHKYQLVLIAAQGLDGFSVYRVYGDEELSEDEVLFEFETDADIWKV